MAARRLIIVMLVLLGISALVSIVVPEPSTDEQPRGETTTGATGSSAATGADGATGNVGGAGQGVSDALPGIEQVTIRSGMSVHLEPGAQVSLAVDSARPLDVAIPALGLTATASEYAPAVFSLILPTDEGVLRIVELESGEEIARLSTFPKNSGVSSGQPSS